MKMIYKRLKPAFLVTVVMFVVCGLLYPFVLTALAQGLFHQQANGSFIEKDGKYIGSELIGQSFTAPEYFWGRVSAVDYNVHTVEDFVPNEEGNVSYEGVSSGSFNYAPSNPLLLQRMEKDIEQFLATNPTVDRGDIPADLVTASGSGLDPHISLKAANIQIPRIVEASGLSTEDVQAILKDNTEQRVFGVLGEDKLNVLKANLAIYEKMNEQE